MNSENTAAAAAAAAKARVPLFIGRVIVIVSRAHKPATAQNRLRKGTRWESPECSKCRSGQALDKLQAISTQE
jgi:hypothetical protein